MGERNLILCDQIKSSTVRDLIKSIRDINVTDANVTTPTPIELIINSPGGEVDSGLALIGAIQLSKTPVHTIVLGEACSMALHVLVSGHKRSMHKMSTLMYHDASSWYGGTLEQRVRRNAEIARQMNMLDSYLHTRTKITQQQIDDVKSRVFDWYIDADEALQLGIVDEVI